LSRARDQIDELTDSMRTSPDPLWARLRALLAERSVDPAQSLLAEFFPDDGHLYFGLVATQEKRAFQFDLDYRQGSMEEAVFSHWLDITESPTSAHSGVVEAVLFRLEREGGMPKDYINPPSLFPSTQHGFSQVVVASGRRTLYVSGQTAWVAGKRLVGGMDLAAQARQAFHNVRTAVEASGGSLADVVSLRIYIVSYTPDKSAAVGGALREAFADPGKPAATWIGVTSLADPGFLIEVEATAVLD